MSLLNFWTDPENALLCVDTRAIAAGVLELQHAAKAVVLPQANCVLACRGDLVLLHRCSAYAAIVPAFDEIAERLPALVEAAEHGEPRFAEPETELVLVGWSAAEGRMAGWKYKRPAVGARMTRSACPGSVAPGDHLHEFPGFPGMAGLKEFCRGQARAWLVRHPEQAGQGITIGGNLVAFALSRDQIQVMQLGTWL